MAWPISLLYSLPQRILFIMYALLFNFSVKSTFNIKIRLHSGVDTKGVATLRQEEAIASS